MNNVCTPTLGILYIQVGPDGLDLASRSVVGARPRPVAADAISDQPTHVRLATKRGGHLLACDDAVTSVSCTLRLTLMWSTLSTFSQVQESDL